ncbi:monovalent cation/H+ antiporter complex subunit F [Chloroflexus aggregans]|jgi:multisubunit Na+/H+ antiporter MnhF subunit|uniref:Multiple resistance and pH regulation protein F n=1 Tax=Chloroflexus aggregans (strain MD-66 / DSM 9485) TaxID=326427 RepID=B8G654_CHLAD|nr:monovalent cation/H+ antiporter complex subunit F [Chloroflexus aggregans]ACL25787.1 multiple resistance and pH regulation protein F [Chloroflexus aggregans DSM 9485]
MFNMLIAILMGIVAISMVLCTARLLMGPSIPDRAMAFDTLMVHVVALVALYVVITDQLALVDAILVVAVLGFLSTVAIARYIEEGRS